MRYKLNKIFKNLNYCLICGEELEKKEENLLICKPNKHSYYINPRPCNSAILQNKKGEMLLAKRKYPPKKDYWDLPGGFINLAETAEESARREIKEELGINVKILKYIGSFYDFYPYKDFNYATISFVFSSLLEDEKIQPKDDVSEVRWFQQDEIPFNKLAFESLKEAIRKFLE